MTSEHRELLVDEFLGLTDNDQRLIIFLYEWGRPLRPGVAADYLDINHSTLNLSIERLKKKDLVSWERYKLVKLMPKGKEMAAHHLNHHEVIHQYLVENLELSHDEAHEESLNVSGKSRPTFLRTGD